MLRHQLNGLAYYTFPSLEAYPELVHAVTTRNGGVSTGPYASLNVSKGRGDDPAAVEENLRRVCATLGLRREYLVSPNQRHTANVRRVGASDRGHIQVGYDALVTDQADVPLLLRYADCVPVLIYDPDHHALALVHSGWRGTVLGMAQSAVGALVSEFGSRPEDMVAAIGPSIGPCCYQVGHDVVLAVHDAFMADRGAVSAATDLLLTGPAGQHHFDLWAANHYWLAEAGVRRIEVSEMCTACHTDEFYSYRAEAGHTGHFAAVMSLRE